MLMPSLDLYGAIALTAAAAVFIFALAAVEPDPPAGRVRIATVLGTWFALIAVAAARHVCESGSGFGTPALGIAVVAPVAALAYAGLRSPAVHATVLRLPVPLLIGVHAVRVLGIFFVLL